MWNLLPQSLRRYLQDDGATRSEIVELVPFDVTIGLKEDTGVDVFALTDIVEDWLGTSFDANDLGEDFARFTTVILDYQDESQRSLQMTQATFVASYEGVTVWTRQGDLLVPDDTVVASIQTQAFLQEDGLLQALQAADESTGLGDAVTNVRASINYSGGGGDDSSQNSDGLDVIIIVAIVIAGLAFLLLGFALYMAWRHSRQAQRKGHALGSPEGTGDESDFGETSSPSNKRASAAAKAATSPKLPTEVDASASGLYPESVISEDISTSLTAYYQSGMGGGSKRSGLAPNNTNNNILNDGASVSSMESYGYSLDGYTNSIAPTDMKDDPY